MPAVTASRHRVSEQRGRWAQCELAQSHIGLLPVSACVSVHAFYSTFTVALWSGFSCFCAALRGYGFCFYRFSRQLPQGLRLAGLPLYAKKEHLVMSTFVETPSTSIDLSNIYLHSFQDSKKIFCLAMWHIAERRAKKELCKGSFFLSCFLALPARTHPESCLNARSHTLGDTFFSRGFLPWCDYNSNAIVPLYVNVYYFSRYICSALLYSILFHPLHISIYIIELLIGLFSLPSALMQAAFEIQRLIPVVRWCEENGHLNFFFALPVS